MRITVDPQKPGELKVRLGHKTRRPEFHEVAQLAYRYYEEEGRPEGKDWEHWFRAEQVIQDGQST